MPKLRTYELSKELNVSSKTVIDKAKEFGVTLTNFSGIDDELADKLRKAFNTKHLDQVQKSEENIAKNKYENQNNNSKNNENKINENKNNDFKPKNKEFKNTKKQQSSSLEKNTEKTDKKQVHKNNNNSNDNVNNIAEKSDKKN